MLPWYISRPSADVDLAGMQLASWMLRRCYKVAKSEFLGCFPSEEDNLFDVFLDQKDAGMSVDVHYLAALATRFHWRCFLH